MVVVRILSMLLVLAFVVGAAVAQAQSPTPAPAAEAKPAVPPVDPVTELAAKVGDAKVA